MSTVLLSLPELFDNYKKWVSKNPLVASDFETTAKWISYFIAGRINNSSILSELVYCLSNLLVLFNDRIINHARKLYIPKSGDQLKIYLTIVEYSEVFLELSAKRIWGERGRWLLITVIQVFKSLARLLLVYHHQEPIIQNPPVPILQRQKVTSGEIPSVVDSTIPLVNDPNYNAMSFTLQRSGRIIRKISVAPPNMLRDWKPIPSTSYQNVTNGHHLTSNGHHSMQSEISTITKSALIAETLYIIKPLVHLGAMGVFGTKAWKPWMIALVMDLSSMNLYHNHRRKHLLSPNQRIEMSRRTVVLLLYLLRSPFYDRYTKDRIHSILKSIANTIPLAGIICNPLAQYLPVWQDTYFYMWST